MKIQSNIHLLDGFWDRLDNEIQKQNLSKTQLAKRCGFDRKTLCKPSDNSRYMCVVYFSRVCSALRVSADYLLFGEEKG